jgi:hypothetical protein
LPTQKPKVVVNCIFNPDSNWLVNLSFTGKFTDTSFDKINNASVFISDEIGNIIVLTNAGKGNYTINSKPLANKLYSLKVKVAGYDSIFASDKIPNANYQELSFILDSLNKTPVLVGNEIFDLNNLRLKIQDTNTINEIYKFNLITKYDNLSNTIYANWERNNLLFTTDNSLLPLNKLGAFLIAGDKNFNVPVELPLYCVYAKFLENGISVDSILRLDNFNSIKVIPPVVLSAYLDITKLSKPNYLYQMALLKQKLSTGELFGSYSNSFTNVQNGLGVFAGQNTIRKKVF